MRKKLTQMSDLPSLDWALNLDKHKPEPPKVISVNGWDFLADQAHNIGPYFTNELLARIHQKKTCNTLIVGEAGIWKTSCGIQICRVLNKRFTIESIVYSDTEYYSVLQNQKFKKGDPLLFDEPQFYAFNRDFFKQQQNALVKSITSQRFLVRPLFIALINANLIDLQIRKYLCKYQIECTDRGKARVMEIIPHFREDKVHYRHICDLEYGIMDNDLCDRDSCLDCSKLSDCKLFRAKYERKKAKHVMPKYVEEERKSQNRENKSLTEEDIADIAYPLRQQYVKANGRIDVNKLLIVLRECPKHINLAHTQAYLVKTILETHWRNDFQSNI